jgi:hypothetical protein
MGEPHRGLCRDLPRTCRAAQLQRHFIASAIGVHGKAAVAFEGPLLDEFLLFAMSTQSCLGQMHYFRTGFGVLELRDVHIGGPDISSRESRGRGVGGDGLSQVQRN